VKMLRNKLQDVIDDSYREERLFRFLKARNFDVNLAEKMLRNDISWRKEMGVGTLLDTYTPPEVLTRYYPAGVSGQDKDGSPVLIFHAGNCDLKGTLQSVSADQYIMHTIWVFEKIVKELESKSHDANQPLKKVTVLFDLENLDMKLLFWMPALTLVQQLVQIYEAHNPDMLKKLFVINAPMLFSMAFAVIKPFLSEVTLAKISVYGYSDWSQPLHEAVEKSELPTHWGGHNTDNQICMGGEVPKSYYTTIE